MLASESRTYIGCTATLTWREGRNALHPPSPTRRYSRERGSPMWPDSSVKKGAKRGREGASLFFPSPFFLLYMLLRRNDTLLLLLRSRSIVNFSFLISPSRLSLLFHSLPSLPLFHSISFSLISRLPIALTNKKERAHKIDVCRGTAITSSSRL